MAYYQIETTLYRLAITESSSEPTQITLPEVSQLAARFMSVKTAILKS